MHSTKNSDHVVNTGMEFGKTVKNKNTVYWPNSQMQMICDTKCKWKLLNNAYNYIYNQAKWRHLTACAWKRTVHNFSSWKFTVSSWCISESWSTSDFKNSASFGNSTQKIKSHCRLLQLDIQPFSFKNSVSIPRPKDQVYFHCTSTATGYTAFQRTLHQFHVLKIKSTFIIQPLQLDASFQGH